MSQQTPIDDAIYAHSNSESYDEWVRGLHDKHRDDPVGFPFHVQRLCYKQEDPIWHYIASYANRKLAVNHALVESAAHIKYGHIFRVYNIATKTVEYEAI